MNDNKKTATIRQLGRKFNMSRDTVTKLLEPLPFELGPGSAHLYDAAEAEKILTDAGHITAEMKRLRLAKLQGEVALVQQKAEDYNRSHISIDQCCYMLEAFWKHTVNEIREAFPNYPDEFLAELRIEKSVTAAMEAMGFPEEMTKQRREDSFRKEGQFQVDLAAGRIPAFWAEDGSYWSDEKGYRLRKDKSDAQPS